MAVAKPGDYIRWGEREGYMCDAWATAHYVDPTHYVLHLEAYKPKLKHKLRATDLVMPIGRLDYHSHVTVPCPAVPECKEARRR